MEIFYHYCSTSSFVEILKSGSLRLSSLTHSNDSLEGRLISRVFQRLANRDSDLNPSVIGALIGRLREFEEYDRGLAFCMSTSEDLLSQWRGYADDGHGVAIGFSKVALEKAAHVDISSPLFPVTLKKVLYSDQEHEEALRPAYSELKELLQKGALKSSSFDGLHDSKPAPRRTPEQKALDEGVFKQLIRMNIDSLFSLKNPAFKEESEWRLIHPLMGMVISEYSVYARRDRVTPYIDLPLAERKDSIVKVFLGPKHFSDPEDIRFMISKYGFGLPEVLRSSATYR